MCSRICKHNYRITIIVKIGYHDDDHSPAGLVVTGVPLARNDMHSPRATVKHTTCLYEQCSPYKVTDCTQRPLVPPSMDNLDSHVTSSSDAERLEHNVPQWHDMFEHIPSFDGNDWHAFITVFERHLHRHNPPYA